MGRPVKRQRADHSANAAALRQNPGEWQPVSTHNSSASAISAAARIRSAYLRPCYAPAGAFDAEARVHGDGYAVHARWLGAEHEDEMRRLAARAELGIPTTTRNTRPGGPR